MGTIKQQIEALEFERQGYATYGKDDRVEAVDEQLAYWRKQLKKRGENATTEPLSPTEKKRAEADGGVISEVEAAKTPPADGEKASNELAAKHAAEKASTPNTEVITEAAAAAEPSHIEDDKNALAAQHAAETPPAGAEPNVVTEAQVVGGLARPARNASSEEWRAFAKSLPAPLDVADDAGRDEIVAAYIHQFAPSGNASKETWVKYANEHGIDPADKSRDEIRAAAVEAGWAKADEPPQDAHPKPKRNTADKTPRTTR